MLEPARPGHATPQLELPSSSLDEAPYTAFWEALADDPEGAARAAASHGLLTALQHSGGADVVLHLAGAGTDSGHAFTRLSQLQPLHSFKKHALLLWARMGQDKQQLLLKMLSTSDPASQVWNHLTSFNLPSGMQNHMPMVVPQREGDTCSIY